MSENWNGGNRAAEPNTAFGRGYDVVTSDEQADEKGSNAYLVDNADKAHVKLTIIAIETDLSLAGSRGQSLLQHDFYPRNFQQPSFAITVQARSQKDVGRVAEFVHKAQRHSVTQGSLMTLIIPSGGLKHTAGRSKSGRPGMKGVRQGINMSGYVQSMPRAHARHDPAPVYRFEFVVAKMHSGIFQDQPYKIYKLAKWSEIVDTLMKDHFIKPPKTVEQEQADEEAREAANFFKDPAKFFGDLFN